MIYLLLGTATREMEGVVRVCVTGASGQAGRAVVADLL